MGQLKRQTLGDVFGAVGHLVFKNRGGVNYISHRPVSYATPQDTRSVQIRNQFRFTSKLAKSINSVDLIKKIWKNKYPVCYSTYHKIFDSNYHRFNSDDPSGTPILTPDNGFGLTSHQIDLNGTNLVIKSDPIPTDLNIDPLKNNFIATASLLMFRYKNRPDDPPVFYPITGIINPLDLNQPVNLTTIIKGPNVSASPDEYVFRLWSVLIILDEKQNPILYSNTLSWAPNSIDVIPDK
jgi:hypothetical protein